MRTQRTFRPTADGLESRDVPATAGAGIRARIAQFAHQSLASNLNSPFARAAQLGVGSIGRQIAATRTAAAANAGAFGNGSLLNQLRSNLTSGQLGSNLTNNQLGSLLGSLNPNQLRTLLNTTQLGSLLSRDQLGSLPFTNSFGSTVNNGLLSTLINRNFPATLSTGSSGLNTGPFGSSTGSGISTSLVAGSQGFIPFR